MRKRLVNIIGLIIGEVLEGKDISEAETEITENLAKQVMTWKKLTLLLTGSFLSLLKDPGKRVSDLLPPREFSIT